MHVAHFHTSTFYYYAQSAAMLKKIYADKVMIIIKKISEKVLKNNQKIKKSRKLILAII